MKEFDRSFTVGFARMYFTVGHPVSISSVQSTITFVMVHTCRQRSPPYHFLQDQYLAVSLLGGSVSHL